MADYKLRAKLEGKLEATQEAYNSHCERQRLLTRIVDQIDACEIELSADLIRGMLVAFELMVHDAEAEMEFHREDLRKLAESEKRPFTERKEN